MSPFWSHVNKGLCECRQSIVSPACLRIPHDLDRGTDGPGVASSGHRGVPRSAALCLGSRTSAITPTAAATVTAASTSKVAA
jgi:hypothetical protein